MSVDTSNNPKYSKLLPEDVEFYERVNSNVTASHALPFEVPVDSFFRIVVQSLKWFWNWHHDATQEQLLFIPKSEIIKCKKSDSNYDLVLPNGIEAVIDWKSASGSIGGNNNLNSLLKIGLLQTYNMSSSSMTQGYGGTPISLSNLTISMYEISEWKETFTRGIRATFNKNSQIFRLMTNPPDGLVLSCMTRLQPSLLYNDILFEEYVTARVEEQLGKIVMTFNFKLPGGIEINYDEIKSNGKSTRDKIEEDIKDSNINDIIQSK